MRRRRYGSQLLLCLSFSALSALASQSFLPPPDHRPKDFAIIQAPDGFWHLFYIKNLFSPPQGQRADREIGHAKSLDLRTWVNLPVALSPQANEWDSTAVWAPSIVFDGTYYWMFYTGVQDPGLQQAIGLARTTSLDGVWERFRDSPNSPHRPILTCPPDLLTCSGADPAFRDPHVIPDPARPGQYRMYLAGRNLANPGLMSVVEYASSGDLKHWLFVREIEQTKGPKVESPQVFQHGSNWFLLYTAPNSIEQPLCNPFPGSDTVAINVQAGGLDLTWGPRQTVAGKLGNRELCGDFIAPEHFVVNGADYFAAVAGGPALEFDEMFWQNATDFKLAANGRVGQVTWSGNIPDVTGGVRPGSLTSFIVNINTFWPDMRGRLPRLQTFVLINGVETPATLTGFPYRPTLVEPASPLGGSAVTWIAHGYPNDRTPTQLIVKEMDCDCQSGVKSIAPGSDSDGGPRVTDP